MEDNSAFVVNLTKLDHVDDIKFDDCGHWIYNGRKTINVVVWKQNHKVMKVVSVNNARTPDENSEICNLVRVYYVNNPHADFKRTYHYLFGNHPICNIIIHLL